MTTPEQEDLIYRAVYACRFTTLEAFVFPQSCIETTRLTCMVLNKLGIKARPQAVNVRIYNLLAYNALIQNLPWEKWPDGAWSLGTEPAPEGYKGLQPQLPGGGWSGHLVVMIPQPEDRQRRLIDVTADQFHRPGKLNVPGPVGITISDLWTPLDPQSRVLADDATIVEYVPLMGERGREWKDTPAWNKDPEWYEATAEDIATQVRAGWGPVAEVGDEVNA